MPTLFYWLWSKRRKAKQGEGWIIPFPLPGLNTDHYPMIKNLEPAYTR